MICTDFNLSCAGLMRLFISTQVLKYYSTMSKAVAEMLEQLRPLASLRSDGDHLALLAELSRGAEPRLARAGWRDVTLVHHACQHGWLDFVKSVIHEYSCDPHAVTQDEATPLHYACRYGRFDFVRYLISEQHCDPHAVARAGVTPLHYACRYGRPDIVRYLISEQHCDPDCCDNLRRTPLHFLSGVARLCTQEEAVKIMRFLFSIGKPDVNGKDNRGDTALILACRYQSAEVARSLIAEGHCDVTIRNTNGDTALHVVSQLETTGETCVYLYL